MKEYGFPRDIFVYDLETTATWPFQQDAYITEFGCVILDNNTLETKDSFHTYVKVPQSAYENANEQIKKLHEKRWNIYLGNEEPPKNRIIINQKQLVPLLIYKFKNEFEHSKFDMIAWNESFDFSWLMKYFFDAGEGKIWQDLSYHRADLKSYVNGLFIANGKTSTSINSKRAYELFEINSEVEHDALQDAMNEAIIFKKFCDILQ